MLIIYFLILIIIIFMKKVEFWPFLGPWVNACPDPIFGGFWWEPDFDVFLIFLCILYNLVLFYTTLYIIL